jgi:hypothetical protein
VVLVETLDGAAESEKLKLASGGEPIVKEVFAAAALEGPLHDTLALAVNAPGVVCDVLQIPLILALLITPPYSEDTVRSKAGTNDRICIVFLRSNSRTSCDGSQDNCQ